MHRIDSSGAATSLPTPAAVGTPGYWTDGDAASGTPATVIDPDWLNSIQEELVAIVLASGLSLSKTDRAQVMAALRILMRGSIPIFSAPGSFTATVPIWATSADVIVTGAGGGSGGSPGGQASGGGGAGGTAFKRITGLTPGASIPIVVGAGGAAGDTSGSGSTANGAAGGSSSFGAYCSATGGGGGLIYSAGPAGGAGGAGIGGDLNLPGGYGSDGQANGASFGGLGGAGYWGGGGRSAAGGTGGAAIPGQAPGSGAGGVYGPNAQSGGYGANGIVHITWRP